jgi:surface antigen
MKIATTATIAARVALLLLTAVIAGCGTPGSGMAGGALLGGASGAAIGSMSANAGKGALIGAAIGALGGALYEQDQAQRARPHDRSYGWSQYRSQPYHGQNWYD